MDNPTYSKQSVSVVMPAYNAANYIRRTIQSLQAQTYTDWELVVVDDCSKDATREVVAGFAEEDSRIRLLSLDKNFGGPGGPRNVGIQNASYEFIAFLDADDIWHPKKLEIQVPILIDRDVGIVCSQIIDFYDESTISFQDPYAFRTKVVSSISQRLRNQVPTSSVLVKRELALAHPFNEDSSYRAVEDYDTWLRILAEGSKCIKVLSPLVHYRKVEGQISGSKFEMLKKVLMVHQTADDVGALGAYFYTLTHLLGALFIRGIKKRM